MGIQTLRVITYVAENDRKTFETNLSKIRIINFECFYFVDRGVPAAKERRSTTIRTHQTSARRRARAGAHDQERTRSNIIVVVPINRYSPLCVCVL